MFYSFYYQLLQKLLKVFRNYLKKLIILHDERNVKEILIYATIPGGDLMISKKNKIVIILHRASKICSRCFLKINCSSRICSESSFFCKSLWNGSMNRNVWNLVDNNESQANFDEYFSLFEFTQNDLFWLIWHKFRKIENFSMVLKWTQLGCVSLCAMFTWVVFDGRRRKHSLKVTPTSYVWCLTKKKILGSSRKTESRSQSDEN